ncbi:MAG: hypothetical protein WDZ41_00130 [Candidatus Babeliales bacterium]
MKFNDPHTTYTGKNKRPFKLVGIEKIPASEKWFDGETKHQWLHRMTYLDGSGTFDLLIDYDGNKVLRKFTNLNFNDNVKTCEELHRK